jgi:hypothetical protein
MEFIVYIKFREKVKHKHHFVLLHSDTSIYGTYNRRRRVIRGEGGKGKGRKQK